MTYLLVYIYSLPISYFSIEFYYSMILKDRLDIYKIWLGNL